jgi:hypothetical protein
MINFDIPVGTTAKVTFETGDVGDVTMGGRFRFYWQGVPPANLEDFVARAPECLVPNNDGVVGTWTGLNTETGRMVTYNIGAPNERTGSDEQRAVITNLGYLLRQRADLASVATPIGDLNPPNVRPRQRQD